jgi:hypothetical protein
MHDDYCIQSVCRAKENVNMPDESLGDYDSIHISAVADME